MKTKNVITVESSDITINVNGQKFEITKQEATDLYNALGKALGLETPKIASDEKINELRNLISQLKIKLFEEKTNPKFPISPLKFPWGNPQWPNMDNPWTKVPHK